MSRFFACYDPATGRIGPHGVNDPAFFAHHAIAPYTVCIEVSRPVTDADWITGGTAQARPALDLAPAHAAAAGDELVLGQAPAGTVVTDDPGQAFPPTPADGPIVRVFTLPGVYRVTVEPPWPWIGGQTEVTVT